jgi:hypothetical protein
MNNSIFTPFKAIYHFFWEKPIHFNSPYTLDETFQYLQDASEHDKQKSATWRFTRIILTGRGRSFKLLKLESINSQSYRFHVRRDIGRSVYINTYAQVEEGNSGVKVVGIVEVNLITRLFMVGCLIAWIAVILIPIQTGMPEIFPFTIVIIGIFLVSIMADQNEMHHTIRATLGKSKQKNSVSEK